MQTSRKPRSMFVPLLNREQVENLPSRAREVVEYRKSGLSLNHIQGCPLDCAYCIRHTYGLWDQRTPRALTSDAEAVEQLVTHRYFRADITPLQLFNRATDPFLPSVRPHTLAVLKDLDARSLRNHVLVITRHQIKREDADSLNELVNIKLTLLFTYSGIDDKRIEPYPSRVAAQSLKLMSAQLPRRYRTILYWRPLVPGLNDSDEHLDRAFGLSRHADATVFTGLFAITCSTRLTSKCTTSGTHTTRAVTDARIPDGRQHQKMTSWASMRYAVVDVEGNGQQPPDLVEVAVVPVAAGIIGAPASWLVKPPRPVSRIAARIHGLTNEALAAAPAFADIESEVRQALDADVLVAHNAHVDVGVLRRHLGGWECPEVLDTLQLARRLLPGQVSYKLGALVTAFSLADSLPSGLVPHRATFDALVTARLFVRLATRHDGSSLSLGELRGSESGGDGDAETLF